MEPSPFSAAPEPPAVSGVASSVTADWPQLPPRPLPAGEAHLYFMRIGGLAEPPPALYALLAAAERERCARYMFMSNRIESTAARALVRSALSRYAAIAPTAWTFRQGEHGKPELAGPAGAPPLSFNVSHTEGLVACLVARERAVGVDVEFLGRRSDIALLARRCLSVAERESLWALPEPAQRQRFLIHWTLKEAYLKARGIGIGLPLAEITLLADDDPAVPAGPPTRVHLGPGVGDTPERWQLGRCRLTAEHLGAFALERAAGEAVVRLQEVTP